jgi:hypothetical protein
MLLGQPSSGSESINPVEYWSQHYFAPWIQDDWKITRKLTLNLGLRWDFNPSQVERHDRWTYAFNTTAVNPIDAQVNHALLPNGEQLLGGVQYVGVNGTPRAMYPMTKTNIQPRFGFAYAINNKTVIRGGFGEMMMNPTPGGSDQIGYSSTTSYVASLDGGQTPLLNLGKPFPSVVQPSGNTLGMMTGLGQGNFFVNPKYKIPNYWSYSFGFQRELTSHDTLEVSYVGSRSYNLDGTININPIAKSWYEQCNVEMGGNHQLCDSSANRVPNPFYQMNGFQGASYYSTPTISAGNLARPFPEFGDITEWLLNDHRSWYNSLQVTGIHKWADSLTLHGTWTWSKILDAGGWSDQTYGISARSVDGDDRTHRVTISGVYFLPVGRGHMFLPNINRVFDTMIGGWELGNMFIYETGWPVGVPGGFEYVGNAKVKPTTVSNGDIRVVAPCVALTDANTGVHTLTSYAVAYGCTTPDFIQRPSYAAVQNVVYTGIRVARNYQFDTNLSKNFRLAEWLKLQFRLEAFNAMNHPLFQQSFSGNNNSNFGLVRRSWWDQSNLPRQVQLAVKLMW